MGISGAPVVGSLRCILLMSKDNQRIRVLNKHSKNAVRRLQRLRALSGVYGRNYMLA